MKTIVFLFIVFIGATLNAQVWQTKGKLIYTDTAKVSIGTSIQDAELSVKGRVKCDNLEGSQINCSKLMIGNGVYSNDKVVIIGDTIKDQGASIAVRALNVAEGEYVSGKSESRMGSMGNWYNQGMGMALSGRLWLNLSSSNNQDSYNAGVNSILDLQNYTSKGSYINYAAGTFALLKGNINRINDNTIISAFIGVDRIRNDYTWAGYFDGRGYFSDKVVIGTTVPEGELTVNGKIACEEIEVKNVGADYVFGESYKLKTLEEVDLFIKTNGHLPGMEPASETEKGVNVGEFSEKLLEKIEELTLYMIELKKENESLKSEIQKLSVIK